MDLHTKHFLDIIDPKQFFNRDVQEVGKDLLGKIIQHNVDGIWISGSNTKLICLFFHSFHHKSNFLFLSQV